MSKKIAVIGVGNLLMGDDGIGIHVIEAIGKEKLPENVKVFDCATRAFDVLECMDGCDKAVIVDACKKEGVAGNIYRFSFDPDGTLDDAINLSMHDINFVDALRAGKESYELPSEIVIIGVEPAKLECSLGLSAELNNALPEIIEAVRSEFY